VNGAPGEKSLLNAASRERCPRQFPTVVVRENAAGNGMVEVESGV